MQMLADALQGAIPWFSERGIGEEVAAALEEFRSLIRRQLISGTLTE